MGASPPDEPYGVRDFKAEFGGKLGVKWLKKRQTLEKTLMPLTTLKDGAKERKRLKCETSEIRLEVSYRLNQKD